jgi:LPXTG-motif cell wall-anchored protein
MGRKFNSLAATAVLAAGVLVLTAPAAQAVAISPTCDVQGIDANANPTGAVLFSGVALPDIALPDLGSGTVATGTVVPVTANGVAIGPLPSSVTQPVPASVSEVKNITLKFKITGAAAVSSATLTGGNVLGATATTTSDSLTLKLPGNQNGSTLGGGTAFFAGGAIFTTPKITLSVTAPSTPGSIVSTLESVSLVAKTSILSVALSCTPPAFPANKVGEVNVVKPGAPVAVNDDVTTKKGVPVTIDVLKNDKPNTDGVAPDPSTLSITKAPAHGTAVVTADHKVTYTPNASFATTDTFTYQVCVIEQPEQPEQPGVKQDGLPPSSTTTTTTPAGQLKCDPSTVTVTAATTSTGVTTPTTAPAAAAVTTTTVRELPRTGSSGSTPLGALGVGFVAIGAAALGWSRRKQNS